MKYNKPLFVISLFVLTILMLLPRNAAACCDILPRAGKAIIDGDIADWDYANTTATHAMYQLGWQPGYPGEPYPLLAKFWMKYDCSKNIMYVLVLAENKIVVDEDPADVEVYITLEGAIAISPNPDTPKEFAWVNSDGTYADGWEASFPMGEGIFDFEIFSNALDENNEDQNAGLRYVELCVNCNVISVELTFFEGYACENGVKLEWDAVSQIDHAGYNIYRGESENGDFIKVNTTLIVEPTGNNRGHYEFLDTATHGDHFYQLEDVSLDGQGTFHGPIHVSGMSGIARTMDVPTTYSLSGNYPNPFNPTTSINYTLPVNAEMILNVYTIQGELVKSLVNDTQSAGSHTVIWDGTNDAGHLVSSGIFIYRMIAGDFEKMGRMTLLK